MRSRSAGAATLRIDEGVGVAVVRDRCRVLLPALRHRWQPLRSRPVQRNGDRTQACGLCGADGVWSGEDVEVACQRVEHVGGGVGGSVPEPVHGDAVHEGAQAVRIVLAIDILAEAAALGEDVDGDAAGPVDCAAEPDRCGLLLFAPKPHTIAETIRARMERIRPTVMTAPTMMRNCSIPGSPVPFGSMSITGCSFSSQAPGNGGLASQVHQHSRLPGGALSMERRIISFL